MNEVKDTLKDQKLPFLHTLRCTLIHPVGLLLTLAFLLTMALYLFGVVYASDLAIQYFEEAYPTQEWLITAVKYSGALLVTVVPILNTILFVLACETLVMRRERHRKSQSSTLA